MAVVSEGIEWLAPSRVVLTLYKLGSYCVERRGD
jgi:hypothetical protein